MPLRSILTDKLCAGRPRRGILTNWSYMIARPAVALSICFAVTIAGCSRKEDPPDVSANAPEAAPSGIVTLPAGSPKLKLIRVEPIAAVELPGEEVTAPGSLEVDPSRVAHVTLPVAGRVTGV